MTRHCLALDLRNDDRAISEYEEYHQRVWPEVLDSIRKSGIRSMEIYRVQNRLFMIMETDDGFSFESKAKLDEKNAKVRDWERLMWKYQQSLPGGNPGEKWRLMTKIFSTES
jgi:L-rhamnose mutarotase